MVFLFKVQKNCFRFKYYITAHSLSEDVISEEKKKRKKCNEKNKDITKAACHVSVNLEIYFVCLTLFVFVGLVCKLQDETFNGLEMV